MSTVTPAKPDSRPARWRWYLIGAVLFLLASIPVACYFLAAWLRDQEVEAISQELDAEDPNWRLFDLAKGMPAPPPDDQNAAIQVLKVRQLLNRTPLRLRAAKLSDLQIQEIRTALGQASPAVLIEAHKLKDLPEGRFPFEAVENPFEDRRDPQLELGVFSVLKLLAADATLQAQDGASEAAAESCQALLHAVHAINDHPSLMLQIVRIHGQKFAVEAIERTLHHGLVSERRLAHLQAALMRANADDGLYHALRGGRAAWHQLFLLARAGKASISKMLNGVTAETPKHTPVREFFLLNGYPEQLRLENDLVRASKLREEKRTEAFRALAKKRMSASGMIEPSQFLTYIEDQQQSDALLRCAIAAVAAERYRLRHGDWPRAAEQLVAARLLDNTLQDVYDGKPLRWKLAASGLVIYTVGPDKFDNGGQLGMDIGVELWNVNSRQPAKE